MNIKKIKAKPSLYTFIFERVKAIGMTYGYNIVLHGSMNRDLALIAIPWAEDLFCVDKMLEEVCDYVGGTLQPVDINTYHTQKSHGRMTYVIDLNRGGYFGEKWVQDPQYYIDISIIPAK